MMLYKYRPYSLRSLEIFINKQIYFPRPDELNDPFDCRILECVNYDIPYYEKHLYQEFLHYGKGSADKLKQFYEDCQRDVYGLGVYSLSKNMNSVLLWSHYADEHRGFVIGFDLTKSKVKKIDSDIYDFCRVTYVSKNPFPTNYRELHTNGMLTSFIGRDLSALLDADRNLMTTKTKPWSYEREYRILRSKSGSVEFDPKLVTEVIFGAAMPDAHIKTLSKLLSNSEWSHVKLKRAYMSGNLKILTTYF